MIIGDDRRATSVATQPSSEPVQEPIDGVRLLRMLPCRRRQVRSATIAAAADAARGGVVLAVKLLDPAPRPRVLLVLLDDVVDVHYDGDEDAEDDVDEKRDECVEVDAGENVDQLAARGHRAEGGEHIVSWKVKSNGELEMLRFQFVLFLLPLIRENRHSDVDIMDSNLK